MSENIEREESALILAHSNIVIVKNVVRDKKINKRKNFSWMGQGDGSVSRSKNS